MQEASPLSPTPKRRLDVTSSHQRRDAFPLGALLRLEDLERDPYPLLARLRESEPVTWFAEVGMWVLTRHDDVVAVLRTPDDFTTDSPSSTIRDTFGAQMLSLDGPEQKKAKNACLAPFTRSALISDWSEPIADLVEELLDSIQSQAEVELMNQLARPVALSTMGIVLGLPRDDLPQIRTWYRDLASALANFKGDEEVRRCGALAGDEMREYLRGHLASAGPGPGLVSRLRQGPLEPVAAVANLLIVLFGGIETTESMIGNAIWSIYRHPEIRDRLSDAPGTDLLDGAIEESLRFEPAVQTLTRHATRDLEIRGVGVAAGETVQCMVGGANRDPAVFRDPDRFLPERPNAARHLSFGLGSHFCLGAQLARLETRTVLEGLLSRFPGLELEEETSGVLRGHEFRKPSTLRAALP